MQTTNPQLYKVSIQQLEILRTLAEMSAQIGDREGLNIIQSAEIAIENRIHITHMNLSALEYLAKLISKGYDYADAEWRTSQCYEIAPDRLRKAYDDRCPT